MSFRTRAVIGGLPRSGSTLLRFVLDRSPEIVAGPETSFFTRPLWQQQDRIDRVAPRLAKVLELDETEIRRAVLESTDPFEAFDRLMLAYVRNAGVSKGGWAEKTPTNCFSYHRLAAENDSALFISTVRHGLDVVTSKIEGHPKRAGYWCSVQYYVDSMVAIYSFDDPRHLVVRYEDMVEHPRRVSTEIFGFLGEEFDPAYLDDWNAPSFTRDLTKVNQPKLIEPIQSSWIGRWQEPQHQERVREFEAHPQARRWLERSGYG